MSRKYRLFIFVFVIMFPLMFLWLSVRGWSQTAFLDVCLDGCPYANPNDAYAAAQTSDVIRIVSGTFPVNLVVTKTVSFIGGYSSLPDGIRNPNLYETVWDGGGAGSVVQVLLGSEPTFSGLTLRNGVADKGGGFYILQSSPHISQTQIVSNAASFGGGIYIYGTEASPLIERSLISENSGTNGAGAFIDDFSSPLFANNFVRHNRATSNGAGFYIDFRAMPSIWNNTFFQNNLGPDWANEAIYLYNDADPEIVNNILIDHSYGLRIGDDTIVSNLIDYNGVAFCRVNCYQGLVAGPHDVAAPPQFLGAMSYDLHLHCSSPYVDAGLSTGAPAGDFDRDNRPQGSGVDMGADELTEMPCSNPPLMTCAFSPGVNLPWLNYGQDFGQAVWPSGSWEHNGISIPANRTVIANDFAFLANHLVEDVRIFVFADGRASPDFDVNGYVTHLDEHFFADFDALLAVSGDLNIVPVLLDFHWLDVADMPFGVQEGGHSDIISDTMKRQSFIDNALRPFLQRYNGHPNIHSIDIINEPEWRVIELIDDPAEIGPVPLADMQAFVAEASQIIHQESNFKVTLGSAKGEWLSHWQGLGLDYYQAHYYDWMGVESPFVFVQELGLDRPVVIGEFPTTNTQHDITTYLDAIAMNGYAGAWPWSLRAGDFVSLFTDPGPAADYHNWMQANYAQECSQYLPIIKSE
ncbi:MAG: hypothetical protein GY803_04035 [Chloroflexi bacterium]|nr:hypothetical protein [Chloroflexota bacterium]